MGGLSSVKADLKVRVYVFNKQTEDGLVKSTGGEDIACKQQGINKEKNGYTSHLFNEIFVSPFSIAQGGAIMDLGATFDLMVFPSSVFGQFSPCDLHNNFCAQFFCTLVES